MLGLRGRRHGRIHTQELIHDSAVSLVQEHHTMQELCDQSGGVERHLFSAAISSGRWRGGRRWFSGTTKS